MKIEQVAVQLYTLRDHIITAEGLASSLKKIRNIGYQAAQLSAVGPIEESEIVRIAQGEGVTLCATHEPSDLILNQPEQVVERLKKLNIKDTAYPYPGGVDFADPRSVDELIAKLKNAGQVLKDNGLRLSYHNHGIEFVRMNGKTVLDRIYDEIPADILLAELDTYWVQYGGGDPVAWCQKMPGRMPLLHAKDYTFTTENKPIYCEIGQGNLDFPAIVQAAEASGMEWFIVEQDVCPGDPFDSLKISFDYIANSLVS
ncbi:MAG: sugar phosphate isomerase/epimerase family protein [Verrucomicrobiales bacterium]